MRRTMLLIVSLLVMISCGGVEQTDKTASSASTKKVTADPKEISHTTSYSDPGTWNSVQVLITTSKTGSDKTERPTDGKVRVTNSSQHIKIHDQDGRLLQASDTVTTKGGINNLTVLYFTQGKPASIEYAGNIVFQYDSVSAVFPVKVQKPATPTFTIEAVPDRLTETSALTDPGTWDTKNAIITLSAGSDLISDNISVFTQNGTFVKVKDNSGNTINNGTISDGQPGKSSHINFVLYAG